jgi:cyanophycinase
MDEESGDSGDTGRLLLVGGARNTCCAMGVLERFVQLAGGDHAQVTLVTTAAGVPDQVRAEYDRVFRKLGVAPTRELRVCGRGDADSNETVAALRGATGIFFTGGNQARLRALVGSRLNDELIRRRSAGVVIGGTSAGATAMGATMILSGNGAGAAALTVRTAPGLGLLPGVLIDMHFAQRGRLPRLISAVALNPDHIGAGIDEETAILAEGHSFEVIGTGVVTVVDGQDATVVHPAGDHDRITMFGARVHLMPAGCVFDTDQRTASTGPDHSAAGLRQA